MRCVPSSNAHNPPHPVNPQPPPARQRSARPPEASLDRGCCSPSRQCSRLGAGHMCGFSPLLMEAKCSPAGGEDLPLTVLPQQTALPPGRSPHICSQLPLMEAKRSPCDGNSPPTTKPQQTALPSTRKCTRVRKAAGDGSESVIVRGRCLAELIPSPADGTAVWAQRACMCCNRCSLTQIAHLPVATLGPHRSTPSRPSCRLGAAHMYVQSHCSATQTVQQPVLTSGRTHPFPSRRHCRLGATRMYARRHC